MRKVKNDDKDSLRLLEYACDNWYKLKLNALEEEKYKKLKFLSKQYFSFNNIKVKQKVDFSNLCDIFFLDYYQLLEEYDFILGLKIFEKFNNPEKYERGKIL